jgi:hypothetical protein
VALLLKEREEELVLSDIIIADIIKKLNESTTKQKGLLEKLEKLNTFGRSMLTLVMRIENHLDEARVLWIGSKAGSTPLTYDKLDFARRLLPKTNQDLVRFKKEVTIIYPNLHLDTRINFEKFGTYADLPAFTSPEDLTMLQKIKSSQRSVHDIRGQLEIVLTFLDQEQEEALVRITDIEEERRRVILSAE